MSKTFHVYHPKDDRHTVVNMRKRRYIVAKERIMDDVSFEKIQEIFQKDVTISPDNVSTKSIEIPKLSARYLKVYNSIKKEMRDVEGRRESLYATLYEHYKFNDRIAWDNKNEIEMKVFSDPRYASILVEIRTLKYQEEYLKACVDVINKMSYAIKNYIENEKFKNGGF